MWERKHGDDKSDEKKRVVVKIGEQILLRRFVTTANVWCTLPVRVAANSGTQKKAGLLHLFRIPRLGLAVIENVSADVCMWETVLKTQLLCIVVLAAFYKLT